jgi:hypothetical protein
VSAIVLTLASEEVPLVPKSRPGSRLWNNTVASPDVAKPKVVRKVTKKIPVTPDTRVIDIVPTGLVESTNEPLEVEEVIRIVLKPFSHKGINYWRDEEREKLYLNVKGQKGKYVGRWGDDTIVACPDSDED